MVNIEQIFTGSEPGKISYVVIAARHKGGWLFVRHRRRGGFELPAGHPEPGEDTVDAAVRELTEETGACGFVMKPVTYYSVDSGTGRQYGRLFYAEVDRLGDVSDTSEIEAVKIFRQLPRGLSLPEVMTFLFRVAQKHIKSVHSQQSAVNSLRG